MSLTIDLRELPNYKGFIFEVAPNSEGFMYGDLRKAQASHATFHTNSICNTFLYLALLLGVERTLNPILCTRLNIPSIKDSALKFSLNLIRPEDPVGFDHLLIQSSKSSPEVKVVWNSEDSIISFYGDGYMDSSDGLRLELWADPGSSPLKLRIQIDLLATISLLVNTHRVTLVILIFASFLLVLGECDWNQPEFGGIRALNLALKNVLKIQYLAPIFLLSSAHIIALRYQLLPPIFDQLLAGNHDLILLPLFTFVYTIAIGLLYLILNVFNLIISIASLVNRIRPAFLFTMRFRIVIFLVLVTLGLFFAESIIYTLVIIFSFITSVCSRKVFSI